MSGSTAAPVPSEGQSSSAILRNGNYILENSSEETLNNSTHFTDCHLDAKIKSVINRLRRTRNTMTEMTYPIDTCGLADLVFEAKETTRHMSFLIRRHFDSREEGIRIRHQEGLSRGGKLHGITKFFGMQSSRNKSLLAINVAQRDKRLRLLEDAMAKVDKHRILVSLSEGSVVPN
ncbi:hypothetical protein G7Z17_g4070 [Cylindrodendrum hubeiense]|uniref:Uncharacterized protein n=1 Tax=Cylindrodendrum hubeiense TaxID=595255 RepID=A0A9P5LHI8_9HYPO|nr:hypothetical protein G7Z17_g4070 [Cylindrodendrum hubeiense]